MLKPALCILGLAVLCSSAPASAAGPGNKAALRAFDYQPASETPKLPEKAITMDYSDADLVNDPVHGVSLISKDRARNWVSRTTYIVISYVALMAILLSLPKTEEPNIIISYMLSGAGVCLGFWTFLCACLLFVLRAQAWMAFLPVSLAMAAGAHMALLKIKRSDISLAELKKSFQQLSAVSKEDARLASIEGLPGNWPEEDFLK